MPEYALTRDGTTIAQVQSFDRRPPTPRGKKGWAWLPLIREIVAHDAQREEIIEDGKAYIRTPSAPPPTHRNRRQAEYIEKLGEQPGFDQAVGDFSDAAQKKIRKLEAALIALGVDAADLAEDEFDPMVAKIDAIKAKYPKPEGDR